MTTYKVVGIYSDERPDKVHHMDREALAINWDSLRRAITNKSSGVIEIAVRRVTTKPEKGNTK